jgi:hypothetical protein
MPYFVFYWKTKKPPGATKWYGSKVCRIEFFFEKVFFYFLFKFVHTKTLIC